MSAECREERQTALEEERVHRCSRTVLVPFVLQKGTAQLCRNHSVRERATQNSLFFRVRHGGKCLYSQYSEGIGESKASLGYTVARLCQTEMFVLLPTKLGKPCVAQNTREGLRSSCLSGGRIQTPYPPDTAPGQAWKGSIVSR